MLRQAVGHWGMPPIPTPPGTPVPRTLLIASPVSSCAKLAPAGGTARDGGA
jgi:hypothetical protein